MEQEREHRRCGRSYNRSSEAGIVDNEGMYQVILKRRVLAPLAGKLELYLLRITFVEINLKPMVVSYICKSIVHYVFLGSLFSTLVRDHDKALSNALARSRFQPRNCEVARAARPRQNVFSAS